MSVNALCRIEKVVYFNVNMQIKFIVENSNTTVGFDRSKITPISMNSETNCDHRLAP